MTKFLSLTFAALVFSILPAQAINKNKTKSGTEISAGKNATHIGSIAADSLVVIAGRTYSFTVDTPEDQGLISTNPGVKKLISQLASNDGSIQKYQLTDKEGNNKTEGDIVTGDQLIVLSEDGRRKKIYRVIVKSMAVGGHLYFDQNEMTQNTTKDLTLYFIAGQRSPVANVHIYLPKGIQVTLENTTVNVIGRGDVTLSNLGKQSIGRVGTNYSYLTVGKVAITKTSDGGSMITFTNLDFRPANGPDLKLVISNVNLSKTGKYPFKAIYSVSEPELLTSAGTGAEMAILNVTPNISNFERVIDRAFEYKETPSTYTSALFKWPKGVVASSIQIMQSPDSGKSWKPAFARINTKSSIASVSGLKPDKMYTFRLLVKDGTNKGFSNQVKFYSGKMDVKHFGVSGEDSEDNTQDINNAIEYLSKLGGGTLLFSKGTYSVRTVHLKSNVYLYIEKGATIKAMKGADAPESTWFSDKKYRSGLIANRCGAISRSRKLSYQAGCWSSLLSETAMFFGERLDNVKIIGNGHITGNGNLVTGDRVMNNAPDNRADKMFS